MWRKNIKKIIRTALFLTLLFGVSNICLSAVQHKNAHIKEYTENLRNADVLVIGSSHAYVNLNGAVLWNECGISSASLGQGEQSICMSYYTLESALRYGKPKLVVFETYMAITGDSYNNKPEQYLPLLSFSMFRNFDSRMKASKFLVNVNKWEYILGFPLYHSDYRKGRQSASYNAGYEIVSGSRPDAQNENRCSTNKENGRTALSETVNEYLMRTIELCKKKDIDLLFLVTPYQANAEHVRVLNSVADLAQREGVNFIDMNNYVDDIGIDLSTEMVDEGHAMVSGSAKNSIWLGRKLIDTYGIKDRRGNESYAAWNDIYDNYISQTKTNYSK